MSRVRTSDRFGTSTPLDINFERFSLVKLDHESRVIRTSDETEEENRNEGEWFFCVSCNFISYTSYYLVSTIPIDTHVYDATKEFVLRDFPVFVTALLSTNSITAWLISFVTYSASKQKINTIMSYNSASVAATSGNDNTRFKSSNHSFSIIITTTTTIVVCGTCCLYQFIVWRARKRSRTIVQQIMDSIQNEDGPLVRVFVTEQTCPLFLCMTLFPPHQRLVPAVAKQYRSTIMIPSFVIVSSPHQ